MTKKHFEAIAAILKDHPSTATANAHLTPHHKGDIMAQFETHKTTVSGKARTLDRRAVRAVKYSSAAKLTRSARPARIREA